MAETQSRNEVLNPQLKDPLVEYERFDGQWVRMIQVAPYQYIQYNYNRGAKGNAQTVHNRG